jgi:hypothetical protein
MVERSDTHQSQFAIVSASYKEFNKFHELTALRAVLDWRELCLLSFVFFAAFYLGALLAP